MSQSSQFSPTESANIVAVDWLTAFAIAALANSLIQFLHEGTHAFSCFFVGSQLQEFSAIHVSCLGGVEWESKIISGSAAVVNIILGFISLAVLRRSPNRSSESRFFFWLFMLLNWLVGAGYWMFSGVANVGDWANVINGWQPHWLWRLSMTLIGTGCYLFFVWFSLKEFANIIGGDDPHEQIRRATKLGFLAYVSIFLVMLLASLFNPYGITGLPAVAALLLALFGMSPLLWMMQWFRAESFVKSSGRPLAFQRNWTWIIAAGLMVVFYSIILGRTLYF